MRGYLRRRYGSDEYWELEISGGTDLTGVRRRAFASVRGSRADAEAALTALAANVTPGKPGPRPKAPARRHYRRQPRPFAVADLVRRVGGPTAFARRTGCHYRQVYRWLAYGLTVDQADRLAVALGLHPSEVWPNWLLQVRYLP